jgi:hypothetical protein
VGTFVPAVELSAAFYEEVVAPQLRGVVHGAALLGWGSDVLGYDTPRSTDHGWGLRLQIFTDTPDIALTLPDAFRGHPTRFGWDDVAPRAWVDVLPLAEWLRQHLGVDPTASFTSLDWLLTPQQKLLGVVRGAVFVDQTGALTAVRDQLEWYPDQIWRWLLACQWHRLAQEEAFVARTAEIGDVTGSAVSAARQVRELMRLALLQRRRYAPYQKWLGTAFAELPHHDGLPELLSAAVHGDQPALGQAYVCLAARHDASGLGAPVAATLGDYFDRPAHVIMADRVSDALHATVTDAFLRDLARVGSIDQVADSTDVLSDPAQFRRLTALYKPSGRPT